MSDTTDEDGLYVSNVPESAKCKTLEERESILATLDYKRFKAIFREVSCDNG